jgi:hypothetical protein
VIKPMTKPPCQWTPAEATRKINECARGDPTIALTFHAKEQMLNRDLIIGDVLHLLKWGFVYEDPEAATRGHFKYRVEGTTPNSDGRTVRVIVIPSGDCHLKIVTVMWRDER